MDITRFCATNSYRPWMNSPLRRDGFLYATNRHIAVRMPDDGAVYAGEHDDGKAVIALFAKCEALEYTWVAVPKVEADKICTHCGGTGKTSACPDCDGAGEFDHHSFTYECQRCGGCGAVPSSAAKTDTCEGCCGTGIHWHDGVDVAHAHYAKRYLSLIAEQCPGAEIGVPAGATETAMWRCGDIVGLLMPMMKP